MKKSVPSRATDWDSYYKHIPPTARLTRRYTQHILVGLIRTFAGPTPSMIELGGANSCFANAILNEIGPREYHAIDTNAYGLELLSKQFPKHSTVTSTRMNVLDIKPGDVPPADAVFSIGLIEHFDTAGTRRAIEAHFDLLRSGGCAIISFPTPTLLYRVARAICEMLGLWKFPDERPLEREEVIATAGRHGEVVFEKTLWPLVFTQRMIVFRKSVSR